MDQSQDMIAYWDFNEPDDDRQAARAASTGLFPLQGNCAQ